MSWVGRPLSRFNDPKLLTGRGAFVACEVRRAVNPLLVEGRLVGGAVTAMGAAIAAAVDAALGQPGAIDRRRSRHSSWTL